MSTNCVGTSFFEVNGKLTRRVLQPVFGASISDSQHSKRADDRNNCDRDNHLHDCESTLFHCFTTIANHWVSTSKGTHLAKNKLRPSESHRQDACLQPSCRNWAQFLAKAMSLIIAALAARYFK